VYWWESQQLTQMRIWSTCTDFSNFDSLFGGILNESGCSIRKVLNTRLWESDSGKSWAQNVVDIRGDVLFGPSMRVFLDPLTRSLI
jgi:hypothetical protein